MKRKSLIIIFIIAFLLLTGGILGYKFYLTPKTSGYLEIEDILSNKEFYINKEIETTGTIVRTRGFNLYYDLVTYTMIKNKINPGNGLSLEYMGNLEPFVEYECDIKMNSVNYKIMENAPSVVYIKGIFKDHGEVTDISRYYLEVVEIEELKVVN
ncbi:MAG: hypothetical protein ABIH38_05450 [Patescibacteria group bacterium]